MSTGLIIPSGFGDIDMVRPMTDHPKNDGKFWGLCLPGIMGGSRLVNIVSPGDKDGNHGTLINGPTWQGPMGRPGGWGSISSSALTTYVEAPTSGVLLNKTKASFASWFKSDSTHSSTLIHHGLNYEVGFEGQRINLNTRSEGIGFIFPIVGTGDVYTYGTWAHVVTVINGDTDSHAIYYNGVSVATSSTAFNTFANDGEANSQFTRGLLATLFQDDIQFFPGVALSASDAAALYTASRLGYPNELRRIRRRTYFLQLTSGTISHLLRNPICPVFPVGSDTPRIAHRVLPGETPYGIIPSFRVAPEFPWAVQTTPTTTVHRTSVREDLFSSPRLSRQPRTQHVPLPLPSTRWGRQYQFHTGESPTPVVFNPVWYTNNTLLD